MRVRRRRTRRRRKRQAIKGPLPAFHWHFSLTPIAAPELAHGEPHDIAESRTLPRCRPRERMFAKPAAWSCLGKMPRDQLDCEIEEVALVEASGVFGYACQQGIA